MNDIKIIIFIIAAINLFCGIKAWIMAVQTTKMQDAPSNKYVWTMRIFAILWLISSVAMCTLYILYI